MKWDIDKALTALEDSQIPGTTISRVFLYGVEIMDRAGIVPTAEELAKDSIQAWCLALGRIQEHKLFIHGRTLRAAYLKARKVIKKLSSEELVHYGLKKPKYSKGFEEARKFRKKTKRRGKQDRQSHPTS